MDEKDRDTLIRMAAFEHVRRLSEVHDHLTATELKPGFVFEGERIPLINPQRGIFKPQWMRFLLSIKTVFPKPGGKLWYDDQREVHRQIFESDETIDYAFMGQDPDAADNRWLREAYENQVPIIYFLGIAPGCYQAMLPAFISGWDARALKARVAFGVPDQDMLAPPENALERRYGLRARDQAKAASGFVPRGRHLGIQRPLRGVGVARAAAFGRSPYCVGQGRAAWPAGGSQRHPTVKNSSCRIRRPSDRDRPGLPAACLGAAARTE